MAMERGKDGTLLSFLFLSRDEWNGDIREEGNIRERETETERADRELTLNN